VPRFPNIKDSRGERHEDISGGGGPRVVREACSGPAACRKAGDAVAGGLIKMENQWAQASKTGNADALAPLLAENFIALDSDGTLRSKAEVLGASRRGGGR
jgi:hypothetical protein